VGLGVAAVTAIVVPAVCEVRHEAAQTRRTVKLTDLTLVSAGATYDEWSAPADVQSDWQTSGLLALFARPPEDQPAPAQPSGDEAAREDTTFDPTWGNGEEPNWDFSEAQPARRMPPPRRYAPVNPAKVSRWWAAKPEPRPERHVKRPLPIPAAARVVPLPGPAVPAAVD
jgi:hypothetical protein